MNYILKSWSSSKDPIQSSTEPHLTSEVPHVRFSDCSDYPDKEPSSFLWNLQGYNRVEIQNKNVIHQTSLYSTPNVHQPRKNKKDGKEMVKKGILNNVEWETLTKKRSTKKWGKTEASEHRTPSSCVEPNPQQISDRINSPAVTAPNELRRATRRRRSVTGSAGGGARTRRRGEAMGFRAE